MTDEKTQDKIMKKINKEQIKILKDNIDKFSKSKECFLFMLYLNPDGSDNITSYGYNSPIEKVRYYLMKELERRVI